jgi:hypothetical protein
MYRHCIHCAAELGSNDVLEAFPVGRTVAFDAAKGRLWSVCPKCARWNLAPFEERWEPVEAAEKAFVDARLRVHSENVGLAKLRDGTRLIRVGQAVPGELAAWRYGDQLTWRRKRFLQGSAGALAAGAAVMAGAALVGLGVGAAYCLGLVAHAWISSPSERRLIHYAWVGSDREWGGQELPLTVWHAPRAVLVPGEGGGIALEVPAARPTDPDGLMPREDVVLDDAEARAFLPRALVHVNRKGAARRPLQRAITLLEAAGGPEKYIRHTASKEWSLGDGAEFAAPLAPARALALEMALHEESERRALQGELALLESAWREAEVIAGIADRLAVETARDGEAETAGLE